MASSVVKILVFFVLDIQGFGRSGQNNRIHGLLLFCLALRPQQVGLHWNDGEKQQSAVEFRFRKRNERNALFRQLGCFLRGCRAMDGPFFGLTLMDLPRLIGKARTDVFKVLLDVMMHLKQHFFELSGRRRRRRRCRRLLCLFRRSRLLLLDMDGAGMRHLLDSLAAASRARNQFFFRLLLKIFKARKPAFKLVLFFADKVVDDHTILQGMNRFVLAGCQGSRDLLASEQTVVTLGSAPTPGGFICVSDSLMRHSGVLRSLSMSNELAIKIVRKVSAV